MVGVHHAPGSHSRFARGLLEEHKVRRYLRNVSQVHLDYPPTHDMFTEKRLFEDLRLYLGIEQGTLRSTNK
jgi:hypothetical protein